MEWWNVTLVVLMALVTISALVGIWCGTGNGDQYKKLSWVGMLNFNLLQWFGIRLARVFQPIPLIDIEPGKIKTCKLGYAILFPIVPWTGWWNSYIPQRYLTIHLFKVTK